MAKKPPAVDAGNTEVVEDFHVADETVEYTDVTGKDDLPADVADPAEDAEEVKEEKPVKKAKAKPAAKEASDEDEIPEDLKGKTPAQLAKMYKEAQSVIGRQGTELGELRKTADQYIKAHLQASAPKSAPKKEEKEPDDIDVFTKPKEAIAAIVANHPALKELQGAAREFAAREIQRRRAEAEQAFQKAHPDAGEVLADEKFREWIVQSPIRKQMLLSAHKDYNLDAANDLFSTWKEIKAVRAAAAAPTAAAAPAAKPPSKPVAPAAAARVPTGGNAQPRAQAGGAEGKIYRRADVIRLMINDPDRYALMSEEISKAYLDGRVR